MGSIPPVSIRWVAPSLYLTKMLPTLIVISEMLSNTNSINKIIIKNPHLKKGGQKIIP
jgi:hypothetical protein